MRDGIFTATAPLIQQSRKGRETLRQVSFQSHVTAETSETGINNDSHLEFSLQIICNYLYYPNPHTSLPQYYLGCLFILTENKLHKK